ncbi:MAG: PAS domain-containing protein [Dongiaceae bacterium]
MNTATPPGSDSDAASDQLTYRFDIPLSEVESAPIKRFDAYWRGKIKDGRLPGRDDIDPAEMVPLLPDIVLLDVEWDPFRCRVRLRGTRAEQFRPKDTTSKYLDEGKIFDPGRREDYVAEMKFVASSHRPAFAQDWMTTRFGAKRGIFAGIWPLASDGEKVDMLVVIEDFAGLSLDEFDLG